MADIKSFLKPLMPIISTAAIMGGPFAVAAAKALENKLNDGKPIDQHIKIDPTADGIHSALSQSNDPEVLLKAQQADQEFSKMMGEQGIDILKIEAGDRADARDMQKQTRSWVAPTLACVFVVGFFVIIGLKIAKVIAPDQTTNDLITTLRDALIMVMAYYFGSSVGSDRKTEILAQK